MNEIILPAISGMSEEGRSYVGALYPGLMLTNDGPKVLEFNSRFGDPETQSLMPRMEGDFAEVLLAAVHGRLEEVHIDWKKEAAICVVLASEGYPDAPLTGAEISGLEEASSTENVVVFHAGTAVKEGKLVTSGGRVLGVTATHQSLAGAYEEAYTAISKIHFDGMQYRHDIAKRALDPLKH